MSRRDQRVFAARADAVLARLGFDVYHRTARPRVTPLLERWFHYQNEFMRNVNFLRLRLVQERGRELRALPTEARTSPSGAKRRLNASSESSRPPTPPPESSAPVAVLLPPHGEAVEREMARARRPRPASALPPRW